jgi:hypothetical protein
VKRRGVTRYKHCLRAVAESKNLLGFASARFLFSLSVFYRIHRRLGTRPRKEKELEMLSEILQPVLVIVFSYLVRLVFNKLKIELNDETFYAIVAALVAWLLGVLGMGVAHSVAPTLF